jgi:hypothetical protein
MATRRAQVSVALDELLIDGEERNPGLSWPLAVDRWLETKLEQARAAGMATSRKELACVLMTAHDPGEEELVELLRRYRRLTVRELLKIEDEVDGVVTYMKQPSGPRVRRGTSE